MQEQHGRGDRIAGRAEEDAEAVDLADTVVTVTDPPTDLLADDARARRFWALQQP